MLASDDLGTTASASRARASYCFTLKRAGVRVYNGLCRLGFCCLTGCLRKLGKILQYNEPL
jgi:hypothetical protein